MRTPESQNDFLKKDLADALKGLFVSAVVWVAAVEAEKAKREEICPFLVGLAASANFVQARSLYEFYDPEKSTNATGANGEDARASHFGAWTSKDFASRLYATYFLERLYGKAQPRPANKRIFHLVYDRSDFSGGIAQDESDHLKNQPLNFAGDLRNITKKFIEQVEERFRRDNAKAALQGADDAANQAATGCKIANPL